MKSMYLEQSDQHMLRCNLEKNLDIISDIFTVYKGDDKRTAYVLMEEIFKRTHPEYFYQYDFLVENRIKNALEYAIKKHQGQYRDSGIPYAAHPVQNGYIAAEFRSSTNTIVISLLHDVLEENEDDVLKTSNEIIVRFGQKIYSAILGQSVFEKGVERDETLADKLWFLYRYTNGDGMFRSKCADGISNLYTKKAMKPKNGMTAEQRIKKFCSNARVKLLPMARVLDEKGDIELKISDYIDYLIRK